MYADRGGNHAGSVLGELIVDPLLLALCDRILRPHCHDYRLSTGELMALGSGEVGQALHRDADSWRYFPEPRPDLLASATIALTDFRKDNGATVLVPGSHHWPRERRASDGERTCAAMPPGSALLYSGNILHGGGANRSEEVRIGLYLGYILSWLRPIENHLITNSLDALRAAPARAQRLLNFSETGFDLFA